MAIRIEEIRTLVNTHKTYNVRFFTEEIHTTVTSNSSVVTNSIKAIKREELRIVGLDVEWRPTFTAGCRNPVATLQLYIGDRCLIYQIIHSDQIPGSLVSFLSLSRKFRHITFVGVGIESDVEKLQSDYGIGGGARCMDLRELAAEEYDMEELERATLQKNATLTTEISIVKNKNSVVNLFNDGINDGNVSSLLSSSSLGL